MASPNVSHHTKLKATDFACNACPPRHEAPSSLLAFAQVFRIPSSSLDPNPLRNDEGLGLMTAARAEVEVQHARRRYEEINRRAVPTDCDPLDPGDLCLVYRDVGYFFHRKPGFTGPFAFLYRQGSIAFVLDGSEVRMFALSHVKPAIASENMRHDLRATAVAAGNSEPHPGTSDLNDAAAVEPGPTAFLDRSDCEILHANVLVSTKLAFTQASNTSVSAQQLSRSESDVWVTKVIAPTHQNYREDEAQVAITEELQGLLDRGTFQLVRESDVPPGANIMGSKMALALKNYKAADEMMKARLVVQGCRDRDGARIVSEVPTVTHFSVRILISLAVIMGWKIWSKDARQAFLQSETSLLRQVLAQLPNELRHLSPGYLVHILKPLHGLKESGSYWHDTYVRAFVNVLAMSLVFMDPCLLFRVMGDALDGVAAFSVDATIMTGKYSFSECEEKMHKTFDMKPTQTISPSTPIKLGVLICQKDTMIQISQEDYIECLSDVKISGTPSMKELCQGRGKPAWVGTWTRPDIAYRVGRLSQATEGMISEETSKELNAVTTQLRRTSDLTLKFPALDLESIYIAAYGDASLGGKKDLNSQMGGVVTLRDGAGNCHMLHWFSRKCPRVTSSILAAEGFACVTVFDIAFALREVLRQGLKRKISLYLFTDSYSLFSTVTRYHSISEKRLLRDVAVIRQGYRRFEIDNMGFVRSAFNIADPLTKNTRSELLKTLLRTGKLEHPVDEYIIRKTPDKHDDTSPREDKVDLSILFGKAWM